MNLKQILAASAVTVGIVAGAQTLSLSTGNVTYLVPAGSVGQIPFTQGTSLTLNGVSFNLSDITAIRVTSDDVETGVVSVVYADSAANVIIPSDLMGYVTASVNGAHVEIEQSSDVGADTTGEITYQLSGSASDGSFTLDGSYKSTIELLGLDLTNPSGAAMQINNGKRIELSAKNGTVNSLTDGSGGSQKGALACKGHLELKGKGTLNIAGNTAHAVYAKEYVSVKNLTLNITSAVKDGINCNQSFTMISGTVTISGVGDDCVQVSYKDDENRDEEDTGAITIEGGTITASTAATASKCLKCEGNFYSTGGTITLSATGVGEWDSDKVKTKAAACIGVDGDAILTGGTFDLSATAGGGKGLNVDGSLTVNDPTSLTISTTGSVLAYINGTLYTNYTKSVDNLDSDYKSSAKGVKCDGDVVINGGTIYVKTTGTNAEGIESKSTLTINGGTVKCVTKDDAINSSSHMYIKGGDVTVVASGNDGLDSNGNLYISGGTIRAFGASSPECGIDANEEEGYTVVFTGGTLLAVGGGNSVPSSSSGSTQAYVSGSASVSAGKTITLKSGSTELASFEVPSEYTGSSSSGGGPGGGNSGKSILITCPGLTSGSRYTLTSGSSSTTVTARLTGSSGGK